MSTLRSYSRRKLGARIDCPPELAAKAIADCESYFALLKSIDGKRVPIGTQVRWQAWTKTMYAITGLRVDFWPMKTGQNFGTGSAAISFLGNTAEVVQLDWPVSQEQQSELHAKMSKELNA